MQLPPQNWNLRGAVRVNGDELAFDGSGSASFFCELDQPEAMPVRISAESRSGNVSGNNPWEYSVLAKVTFADGTTNRKTWAPLNDGGLFYTDYAPFPNRTHDWHERSFLLSFEKPIRGVEVCLYFRNHGGSAAFRNVSVRDYVAEDTVFFDYFPVETADFPQVGFFLRDCTEKPFRADTSGAITFSATRNGVYHTVKLSSRDQRDHAVTLYYTVSLPEGEVQYLPEIDRAITACGRHEYAQTVSWRAGANGLSSKVPFCAVSARKGVALGFDPAAPVLSRAAYNAPLRRLYAAFDVALTAEKPEAEIHFCEFDFDLALGYRGALAKYYSCYPDFFEAKIRDQGNWMPLIPVRSVPGWEDFGFRVMEYHFMGKPDEQEWNREHGILSFRYTEPMTFWLHLPKDSELTREQAESWRKSHEKDTWGSPMSILDSSVMQDENGDDILLTINRPWCRGAVYSINSLPGLDGNPSDFQYKWNGQTQQTFHSPESPARIDGEYIDSAEGYMTADISHRRSHFSASKLPLSFSADTFLPGVWKGTIAYGYIRQLRDDIRPNGHFVMANGTPGSMWFLPPLLDVAGTETDWNPDGEWTPLTVSELRYCRAASADKPYCFLMNTDFTKFSHELVEKYMKRALVFGMFPGFFSANAASGHYFQNPALYERDRVLFRKYLPLISKIANAGWRPVTEAHASPSDGIAVEQFGDCFFTVLNDSGATRTFELQFDCRNVIAAKDLISGTELTIQKNGSIVLTLPPEDIALIELSSRE